MPVLKWRWVVWLIIIGAGIYFVRGSILELPERERVAAEEQRVERTARDALFVAKRLAKGKQAEKERAERTKEWTEGRDTITAEVRASISKHQYTLARERVQPFRAIAKDEISALEREIDIAEAWREYETIRPSSVYYRENAADRLAELLPDDPKVKKLVANARRASARERVKEKRQELKEERQELARRKKEGVSVGMAKEDVLLSSWGKPERINSTVTAGDTREQWVYGNGHYLYFRGNILTSIQTRK